MARTAGLKRWAMVLAAAAIVAGCGADGEPVQPTMDATIGIGSGGVNGYGALGLHRGPVSLYLGF